VPEGDVLSLNGGKAPWIKLVQVIRAYHETGKVRILFEKGVRHFAITTIADSDGQYRLPARVTIKAAVVGVTHYRTPAWITVSVPPPVTLIARMGSSLIGLVGAATQVIVGGVATG
jgi:hypothetical protein